MVGVAHQDLENVYFYLPAFFCLVLFTHAISMQQRRAALQQAQLLESQLRAELLRKHIQPHFLLNTLTSLMEWIETDVERGTEFIAELADEFRMMSKVSSKQLIEIKDEIELCERHLALMSLRLQKTCRLSQEGLAGTELIPPAIFHTLLENAFSHNVFEQSEVVFTLSKHKVDKGQTRFAFKAPRGGVSESSYSKLGTGTGNQYIEARLGQSFGQNWQMKEVVDDSYWTTEIVVDYTKLKPLVSSILE